MSTIQCENCGHPLLSRDLICEECGASIREGGPNLFAMPGLTLPEITLKLPATPLPSIPNLEQHFGSVPHSEKILWGNPEVAQEQMERGCAYQLLAAIGKHEQQSAVLNTPFGVVWLQAGKLYIADFVSETNCTRVLLFDESGNPVQMIREFNSGDNTEVLDTPASIAADAQGNFYIADMGSCCIKKFSSDGILLATFGSEGVSNNELIAPQDLVIDHTGCLYIADTDNNRILKWDQQGNTLLILGINQLEKDMDWMMAGDQPGEFDGPKGITIDSRGNIFVADTNNHRVQKFSPLGELLFVFGEEGEDAGQLHYPNNIRLSVKDEIYVSNSKGSHIQKFDAHGHFICQIALPGDAGSISDFDISDKEHLFVALRHAHLVLKLKVV